MRPSPSARGVLFVTLFVVLAAFSSACDVLSRPTPPNPTFASTPLALAQQSPTTAPTTPVPPPLAVQTPTLPPATAARSPTLTLAPVTPMAPTRTATVRLTTSAPAPSLYANPDQLWSLRFNAAQWRPEVSSDGTVVFRSSDRRAWAAVDAYIARGNEFGNTGEGLRNRARDTVTRLFGRPPAVTDVLETQGQFFWETGITFTTTDGFAGEALYAQPERNQGDLRVYGIVYAFPTGARQVWMPAFQSMRGSFLPVVVRSLNVASGRKPLWLVFSRGMRNYDPLVSEGHFVAIFSRDPNWQEVAHLDLQNADYVDARGVNQAQVEPSRIWIAADSGIGAHGGCFELVSFDYQRLKSEVASCNTSPGAGELRDLNGDGVLDVILNASENYVFCYACGVRFVAYRVLRVEGTRVVAIDLTPLPAPSVPVQDVPVQVRDLTNRAVELARAELWQEARPLIEQARALAPQDATIAWNAALIRLHADARAAQARSGAYPLLDHLFNGDYIAVLSVMRPYTPAQLFTLKNPLVVGTSAEGWEDSLAMWITQTTTLALKAKPNFASAYFVRGWGTFQSSPGTIHALADLERAAQLEPTNSLFTASAAFVRANALPPLAARERIQFAPGASSTTVSLNLAPNAPRGLVLRVRARQTIIVTFPSSLDVAVLDGQDRRLSRGLGSDGRVQVMAEENGDYTVVFFGQGAASATIAVPPR